MLGQKAPKLDTVFCDCEQARIIPVNGNAKVNKTIPPEGQGTKQEISEHKQRTKYAFEKEHHSAWYKLIINTNGHLCLNITPSKKEDDYDFMLFKGAANGFCDSLSSHRIKPVRACISRDKEDLDGKTGMSYKGRKEFVNEGVGDAYVTPIYVTKGEIYYLVLDNVYEKGEGHSIQFYFEEPVKIKGVILDEKNKPLIAEIALTNPIGDTVFQTKSNMDGTYEFDAPLRRNQNYSLNFYNDSTFIFTKNLTLKDSSSLKDIRTLLPYLRKGLKYSVGSINFKPGLTEYLPQALPSINNLYKLLKKNKNLKIKIIGHSNGRGFESEKSILAFTNSRAERISGYLLNKGIDNSRVYTEGRGDKEMLFKLPGATEEQQEQNRRVEVLVLEF